MMIIYDDHIADSSKRQLQTLRVGEAPPKAVAHKPVRLYNLNPKTLYKGRRQQSNDKQIAPSKV